MSQEWTKYDVAEHTGMAPESVSRWARRHGITARPGQSEAGRWIAHYSAEEVRRVRASQPGSGNRTPRKEAQ